MRILLVEDDEILRDLLVQSLSEHRYLVETAEDGQLGWQYAQDGLYDLLIIDVGLPRLDGITLCQRLRGEACSTPILLMTARDAPEERIRGLDAGADDYLTKPLDLGELQARVRALLRRGEVSPTSILAVGPLRLDPVSCEVTHQGSLLKLTPKEYSLLELFLRNPTRVFSRGQIVEHLWSFDDPPLEESVKAHVKGLRRKLKAVGTAEWIENVYGLGYRLNPNAATKPAEPIAPLSSAAPTEPAIAPSPTAPSTEQDFNQAMDKLWQQHQGLMIERLQALQAAAQSVEASNLTSETRQAAAKAAHKLAGVLGMFGKDQGTQLARDLETLLNDETAGNCTAVPQLVQQLADSLNLQPQPLSSEPQPLDARLLWIGNDRQLEAALPLLTQSAHLGWQITHTLTEAEQWLSSYTPEVVVLQISAANSLAQGLPLLAALAARTPAVPSLVMTESDELGDRIQMAAAGVQRILTQPVTAVQLWQATEQLWQRQRIQAVHLLAVDDDPILLDALRPMLEPWGMRLTTLSQPAQFWDVLRATSPDLLILDVEMPDFSGIELCQAVRTDVQWQDLPIVFLTAHRDAETVQQIFTAGADDYVTKPILGAELLTRITNRLERNRLLQTLSNRDAKTGLDNQARSYQTLEQLLRADRAPVCLVLLSLPEMAQINVRYGHAVGNQVLKRWGESLRSALRGGEVSGYWEHGEFVIGLAGCHKAEVLDRLSPLLAMLRKHIFVANGDRFQVNYTVQVAEYPTDGTTVQGLYRAATQKDEG